MNPRHLLAVATVVLLVEAPAFAQSTGPVNTLKTFTPVSTDARSSLMLGTPLVLRHTLVAGNPYGEPTHYRVAPTADFRDAVWQRYSTEPLYRWLPFPKLIASCGGGFNQSEATVVLYFQVRHQASPQTGSKNELAAAAAAKQVIDSNVLSKTLCVGISG